MGEGRGYFYYDHHNLEPAFPFGHGLSYTSFAYKSIHVASGPDKWTVSVQIANIGSVAGEEVLQLYVSQDHPSLPRRVKDLRGFARVGPLAPGQDHVHEFSITAADLSYYDDRGLPEEQHGQVDPDTYTVRVGASSRDLRLETKLAITIPMRLNPEASQLRAWQPPAATIVV